MSQRKITVDLPHLAFATLLGGWSAWLCWDAWRSSPDVENLILIVPVAAIAVLLYLFVAAGCFRKTVEKREPLANGIGIKIAGSMVLLGAFVVAGPLIGFDIASFVYMLAIMFFLGERRILPLVLVPILFCATAIYCFNNLLATPLPLFFFSGQNS